jgi:hypothetical protein
MPINFVYFQTGSAICRHKPVWEGGPEHQ